MAKTTTPDLDALLAANTRRTPGGVCSIGTALSRMDLATRAKIQAALDDVEQFSSPGLALVFRSLGYDIARSSVGRHRARECKCPR